MAYDFKKLSDVATVETPADTANVLIEEDGVIKKAAKDKVGGAGGLEVTSTAKVGQTIVVKAVDENGKPTEWECDDLDLFITFDNETYREDGYHVVLAATNNLYEKIQKMLNNHCFRNISLYNFSSYNDTFDVAYFGLRSIRPYFDDLGATDKWHLSFGSFTATVHPDNRIDVQYYD